MLSPGQGVALLLAAAAAFSCRREFLCINNSLNLCFCKGKEQGKKGNMLQLEETVVFEQS